MTQNQAKQAWGVHPRMLAMLEGEGKLFGIAVGNRVYYRLDQLLEQFGEPTRPEVLRYLRPCYDEHAA